MRFVLVMFLLLSILWIPISVFADIGGGTWTACSCNPILSPTRNSWDNSSITYPRVIFDGKLYYMWYTGFASTNRTSSQIGYASSSDGKTWVKNPQPVLRPSHGSWDDHSLREAWVILDGSTFKMWYVASGSSEYAIGYATSPDGKTWTKYAKNPIIHSTEYLGYPTVIEDGHTFKMWYAHALVSISYAISTDGITWTWKGDAVKVGKVADWDAGWLFSPSVIHDSNGYKMWYSALSADGRRAGVGFAFSSDGVTWTKYSGNPVLPNTGNQVVVLVGKTYMMYYPTINGLGLAEASFETVIPEFPFGVQYFTVLILLATALLVKSRSMHCKNYGV